MRQLGKVRRRAHRGASRLGPIVLCHCVTPLAGQQEEAATTLDGLTFGDS